MALLNIFDQISESVNVKKYSIGILLDLSKAFDTIDHRILLQKLTSVYFFYKNCKFMVFVDVH